MDTDSYYNIDIDLEELMQSGGLDDIFYLKDLKQRQIFMNAEIYQESVAPVVRHIIQYNREDRGKPVEERKPIMLYLSSGGGDLTAGFSLIDTILASKTPIYTINTSIQYSMGFLIGLAGHKRYSFPTSTFLLHDGSSYVADSTGKVRDTIEFNNKFDAKIKDYVLSRTKITAAKYERNRRVEWYMFPDEALELGVTDYVVGVNCDIDEVV